MPLLEKPSHAVLVAVLILLGASSLAHALYVKFEGTNVTWSNTKLGGGPAQPTGWVQVPDIPPGFTGVISARDFISVSSVVYGTYETVTWGREHVHDTSKVSFREGEVSDINLVFIDAVNARLLVVSGPPTANAVLVNTPRPPCVHWLGFDDLEFCGARVAVEIATSAVEPSGNVVVKIPPTPRPTYAAYADASINGSLNYSANGGLLFDYPYSKLNPYGPFRLTATLEWRVGLVDEPRPHILRVWFTKVHIDHVTSVDGHPVDLEDDDYWALGEPLSWNVMKWYTLARINAFCEALTKLKIGVCLIDQASFDPGHAKAAFGLFNSDRAVSKLLSGPAADFLFDLAKVVGPSQLSDDFQGSLTHKANTVPVLEQ